MPHKFSKVLIANRGEIALRVMRSARALGYRTVAVYSEADAGSLHVSGADEAVCIGPAPVCESYLHIENIIAACKMSGADAVHPGYGFLSENADFAEACHKAGLVFIGPEVKAIHLMGNKAQAKRRMIAAGVPCIPGYSGQDQAELTLVAEAKKTGFPLMLKAAAGGGGRGMRLVHSADDFLAAVSSARSEAVNAFGSDELILETALLEPRHIEIQVFADQHGNVVHLGERDCSIQRRHQKVIEETPSPAVSVELRARMGETAVAAARAIDYVGAGTIEFLLDKSGEFYFMEMNTRLQVEHAVTEAVTGLDLVEWQLRVAAGEMLPLEQHEITLRGHAIEARLYAEDPANNFLPCSGTVLHWQIADCPGVRVDHGLQSGAQITPYYDPMIAKVIGNGTDREEARRRLLIGLEDTTALGLKTNKRFLLDCLRHPAFVEGKATTAFIATHFSPYSETAPPVGVIALAAVLFHEREHLRHTTPPTLVNWSSNSAAYSVLRMVCEEKIYECTAHPATKDDYRIMLQDGEVRLNIDTRAAHTVRADIAGVRKNASYSFDGESLYLELEGVQFNFADLRQRRAGTADGAASDGHLCAPMNGKVVALQVAPGDTVRKGQVLLVIESMKMEHPLLAPQAGVVEEVRTRLHEQLHARQVVVKIKSD